MLVVFVPPATGFRHDLRSEFAQLSQLGCEAEFAAYPEQRRGDLATRLAWWEESIQVVVEQVGSRDAILVGFNLGGSVAATAALRMPRPRGLIAAGSVPRLSQYPEASDLVDARLAAFDLTSALTKINQSCLIQFGRRDEWLLPRQTDELVEEIKPGTRVSWHDDDHDMGTLSSLSERLAFVSKIAERPLRIFLRRFLPSDGQAARDLLTNPNVTKTTGFRTPQSESTALQLLNKWITEVSDGFGVWAAVRHADEKVIGWGMLKPTGPEVVELGYMIIESEWGNGYATEIAAQLTDYAAQLQVARIEATVDLSNQVSMRILRKLWMKKQEAFIDERGCHLARFALSLTNDKART